MLTEKDKLLRRNIMTGSRIAAVAGLSPFAGPMDVYLEMTEGKSRIDEKLAKRGERFEPVVLACYADETGAELRRTGTVLHPSLERVGATPDAIAVRDGSERVVEAKTCSPFAQHDWGQDGTDQVPDYYNLQGQFECGVVNLPLVDFPVLFGLDDLRIYTVDFDPDVFGMLVEIGLKFLRDHIDAKRPPPPDASEAYGDWLAQTFPTHKKDKWAAPSDADRRMATRYSELGEEIKKAKAERETIRNTLGLSIGDAEGLDGVCTFRWSKGKPSVDYPALFAEAKVPAELIAKHTKRTPYRTLRMLKNGDDNE